MPRDWNDPNAWGPDYLDVNDKANGGRLQGYSRAAWHQVRRHPVHGWNPPPGDVPYHFVRRWQRLTELFPIDPADRVIVLGAGPGFLVEAAHAAGFPNVWGIEKATPALEHADRSPSVILVDIDAKAGVGGQAGSALRKSPAQGGTGDDVFDLAITEQLLEDLPDTDIGPPGTPNTVGTTCELLTRNQVDPPSRCVHMVIPVLPDNWQDPTYNWHTIAEYMSLLPGHQIVNLYGNWTVNGG